MTCSRSHGALEVEPRAGVPKTLLSSTMLEDGWGRKGGIQVG